MDTIAQGRASEAAVLARLMAAGYDVLLPFAAAAPYDMAIEAPPGQLLKIQVKTGRVRNDAVIFNAVATDHGLGARSYHGVADVIAVHVPELRTAFVVEATAAHRSKASLRLAPARNGQRRRIRFAEEHTFERWLATLPGSPGDAAGDHLRHPPPEGHPPAA